jgi:amino acid adenylation domain-containing protein
MERSIEMVVALAGILKAGGAYVPLDPESPFARTARIVDDGGLALVLAPAGRALPALSAGASAWLPISVPASLDDEIGDNVDSRACGANLAYVIYTSGSTGQPKGVMNTHAGICNRLLWMQQAYGLHAHDRVLHKTPFTFDVSVWELFWPLLAGSALVVAPPGSHRDPATLVSLIADEGITTMHFVPSMMRAFLGRHDVSRCRTLARVVCSGEALTPDLQRQFFEKIDAELHNLYGPTEAAVDVTFWPCDPQSDRVPIGRPIANTQVYVLDDRCAPVPPGVIGMLYLGGAGLARGYLGRAALTAEKFVPDPFASMPGARLFKTGDLARYRHDGAIDFIGRVDHQVKLRGARIELGEIEAVLGRHPEVNDVAVVVRGAADSARLAAYVVLDSADALSIDEIRRWLRSQLPDYMIPASFTVLDRMPTTSSGKLDRKALPEAAATPAPTETVYVAPRTELERIVAALWADVLEVPQVGLNDNFFDLGGHSLVLVQLASRVRETFDVEIPVRALLDSPTVAGMVVAIAAEQLASAPDDEAERVLAEITTQR